MKPIEDKTPAGPAFSVLSLGPMASSTCVRQRCSAFAFVFQNKSYNHAIKESFFAKHGSKKEEEKAVEKTYRKQD